MTLDGYFTQGKEILYEKDTGITLVYAAIILIAKFMNQLMLNAHQVNKRNVYTHTI